MITNILEFIGIFIICMILLVMVGCSNATAVQPLTFQNDTSYTFTAYLNDGTTQLPNINAHSGQTYTWASLKTACYAGSCEMLVDVIDSNELLYIMLDPVNQKIDEWTQVGESDVCIQEVNNTFHLFPGCAKK